MTENNSVFPSGRMGPDGKVIATAGISKRELIAATLLGHLISAEDYQPTSLDSDQRDELAVCAIDYADRLLARLSAGK